MNPEIVMAAALGVLVGFAITLAGIVFGRSPVLE